MGAEGSTRHSPCFLPYRANQYDSELLISNKNGTGEELFLCDDVPLFCLLERKEGWEEPCVWHTILADDEGLICIQEIIIYRGVAMAISHG